MKPFLPVLPKGPWKGHVDPGVPPWQALGAGLLSPAAVGALFDILSHKEFIEQREANNYKTKADNHPGILSP